MSLEAVADSVPQAELEGLEVLWQDGLGPRYDHYLGSAARLGEIGPRIALAAALVETAIELQGLGGAAAEPAPLLLADLCLARASRLLAGSRNQRLQTGFARAIERTAAAAAAIEPMEPLRPLLISVIEG